jgi:Carboxypeptidase regulatory-like domain
MSFPRSRQLLTLLVFLFVQRSHALILVGSGNKPVSDPGWPSNAVEVANQKSRIGWWEGPPFGGGEWHFEYVGDTTTFQQSLDAFAKIQSPALDLFIHDGAQNSFVADPNHKTTTNNVDWTFTIWVPKNWQHLYGNAKGFHSSDDPNFGKPMPPPRLDLYPNSQSKIAFEDVKVPSNVTIHDERASAVGVDTSGGTVFRATILDAGTHRPIEDAQLIVTARDEANQYTKPITNALTNKKGVVWIAGIPAGTYQVSATANGYVEAAVAYGDYPEHTFNKFEVALAKAGMISGSVVDENSKGIPNIRVVATTTLLATNVPYRTLKKPEAVTDDAGRFRLTNLPIGLAQIWTYSTNYFQTNLFDFRSVPGSEIVIPVRRAGALRVTVRDPEGHGIHLWQDREIQVSVEPVGGAVIGSYGGGANVDTNGTYLFVGVHPGDYTISASPSGKKVSATVEPGGTAEAVIELP